MSRIILGRTLSFHGDPEVMGERESHAYEEHGALVIGDDGRILRSGQAAQ